MWEFYLPTRIIFGRESLNRLGIEIKSLGEPVLLVTGKKAIRDSGILDRVNRILNKEKIACVVYDRVSPEPDTEVVDRGVTFARQNRCKVVVGIGGGSAIDVAKAIAGLGLEENFASVAEYLEGEGTKRLSSYGLPFIAIPTTAGTGAEVARNAVIINKPTRSKRSFRSNYLFARIAIIDPTLTINLPQKITASSGVDTLTHLVEGYVSRKANIMTDVLAIRGISLVGEALISVYNKGSDLEAREKMCLASLMGGVVLTNSGLGIAHGVSPFLGALHGIPHGVANGILLPRAIEFNLSSRIQKFKSVALALGEKIEGLPEEEAAYKALSAVERIVKELAIPRNLGEFGVKSEDLPELAKKSLTSNSTRGNPRQVTYEDLLEALRKIL
ncbi:iron-containing alcohol dehydrogenase [bacterium]|nr:iron-containing alcohol dehydrogenase [bacterium]NIN93062.1 iron-containing alcohol dehydrogenase [bacterium]NIO18931.1 iron-containing alcohol dehydrogenase [bacterium]NIO74012.1 iron-containing alcohol dehydrogenase [bacterium]